MQTFQQVIQPQHACLWSPCRLLKADAEHILSMFYRNYLLCMESGLQGIVYIAGPQCTAKQDGKVCGKVLSMKLGDEDLPDHTVCDHCPASYSQEELCDLMMKDMEPKVCQDVNYALAPIIIHILLLSCNNGCIVGCKLRTSTVLN